MKTSVPGQLDYLVLYTRCCYEKNVIHYCGTEYIYCNLLLHILTFLYNEQEQDDTFASREVAESMGLVNSTLLP